MSDGELVLVLNAADDPVIERLLIRRIALTLAEHLAFVRERHGLSCSPGLQLRRSAPRGLRRAGETGRRAYPSTATWHRCSNGAASSAAGPGR